MKTKVTGERFFSSLLGIAAIDMQAMELQKVSLCNRWGLKQITYWPKSSKSEPFQLTRNSNLAIKTERDESPVEKGIKGWGEKQTIFRIKSLTVSGARPWLNV